MCISLARDRQLDRDRNRIRTVDPQLIADGLEAIARSAEAQARIVAERTIAQLERMLAFSYPLIGNYGVDSRRLESDRVCAEAIVMRRARPP